MSEDALWDAFGNRDDAKVIQIADEMLLWAIPPLHVSGLALLRSGQIVEGAARLRACANIPPLHPSRSTNAVMAALDAGQPVLAEEFAREGLAAHPGDPDLTGQLANALHLQSRNVEALAIYDALLESQPGNADLMINKASALTELGQFDEAEKALVAAAALAPSPLVDMRIGMFRLRAGDFQRGWRLYARRWDLPETAADRARLPARRVKTEIDIRGKVVALTAEQGLGDSIQFIRYLPMVREKAKRVIVLTHPTLARLFRASFPDVSICTTVAQAKEMNPDVAVPLLDLPGMLGTALATVPGKTPYLTAPLEDPRLPPRDARRPLRVGLCWSGNSTNRVIDRRRSIPLSTLSLLARVPGIDWVSLQYGSPNPVKDTWAMHEPLDGTKDMGVTASVIAGLDLVISVDTSVCHLAGALGVPVWIMSRLDGCWRWMTNRSDSPWYPSATIYRQKLPGDWSHVVEDICERLYRMRGEPDA